ncbi:hypothetical protein [Novosphingobium acidiphilum]|jgi:hypothetical protein|uniref:hypothetical protein n=1 Tax=Novosphingobium acidiphilum TaxID=505248 RepID=UPI00040E2470|nr:hypothetical protein [Novosphingobium acidiphilum]
MPSYRAREPIYLNSLGRMVDTDEVFTSDEPPGLAWILIDPPAAAVVAPPRKPAGSGR